ncbi:PAS domain-containing protein [Pelagibius sp. 7325]|uniref:PAS domain-containing protein n=1 Tax=Pelagibius sp. 7325 TaxID=3131994 RepID=UPI0030ED298A
MAAEAQTAERFLEQVDDPRLVAVYRYWDGLRGTRFAPSYPEIDPIDIPRLLRYLLVTDVEATPRGRRYRYRLCGTEVEEHFGIAMRGCYIDTLMQGSYRSYIEGLYDRLVERRSPVYSASTYDDRVLQTKRLMLPLSSDGLQVDTVLAAQVFFRSARLSNTVLAVQADFEPELERIGGK